LSGDIADALQRELRRSTNEQRQLRRLRQTVHREPDLSERHMHVHRVRAGPDEPRSMLFAMRDEFFSR
jgi:hypothetical protein